MREFENENIGNDVFDTEKNLLYIGDDTTDLTEAAMQRCWPEEKSVWDNV